MIAATWILEEVREPSLEFSLLIRSRQAIVGLAIPDTQLVRERRDAGSRGIVTMRDRHFAVQRGNGVPP
jgi:hypothetical protein